MASGLESLELTGAGNWESFPEFADEYIRQIGAKLKRKLDAPDIRIWEIEYMGSILNFVYDDYPNGLSLEPKDQQGQIAVNEIYKLAIGQRNPNGL